MKTKEYNSTKEGQMAICKDADSRAVAFTLNAFVKKERHSNDIQGTK